MSTVVRAEFPPDPPSGYYWLESPKGHWQLIESRLNEIQSVYWTDYLRRKKYLATHPEAKAQDDRDHRTVQMILLVIAAIMVLQFFSQMI